MKNRCTITLTLLLSLLLPWGDRKLAFFGEYAGHGYQANNYGFAVGGGISLNGCFLTLLARPKASCAS